VSGQFIHDDDDDDVVNNDDDDDNNDYDDINVDENDTQMCMSTSK